MITATLDKFFDELVDIPDKNYGGCLFFCYVFWLWLLENNLPTESFQILQHDYSERSALHNLEWINGNRSINAGSSSHFTWMYEGVEYDAEGEYTRNDDYDEIVELAGLNTAHCNLVGEFCINALTYGEWNCDFDRRGAISIVEDRLGVVIPREK